MKKLLFLFLFVPFLCNAQECHIVFGVSETPYKPYSWIDKNNKVNGINIELFQALVEKTPCTYEVKPMPWTDLTKGYENGDVTVIASSQSTFPDSIKGYNVLQIPINIAFYGYFYTRTNSDSIRSLDDLNGKKVLVMDKSVSFDYINSLKEDYNIKITAYPSTESAIAALASGVGDAAVFSLTAGMNIIETEGYENIKVSGRPMFPAPYGFLVHKEDVHIFDMLNTAMEELKADGTYFDIMKKGQLSPDTGLLWFKRGLAAACVLLLIIFIIIIWNKILQGQVAKKTEELNKEIEQRKLTEQENLKLRDEAMIAGKLAVLGEMASSIVHEINNPTGLIIHNLTYLENINKDTHSLLGQLASDNDTIYGMQWRVAMKDADDAHKMIDESVTRITETINELKEYSKEQADTPQVIDLKECLNISVRLTRYFIKEHTNNFKLDIKPGEYKVFGNMLHIEQVIINLIHNACYALTSKKQAIVCTLDNDTTRNNINYACISIIDEGCGMSDEVINKLFTPFFTTRKDSGGTGLGLTIVRRMLEEHKGFTEVTSGVGKGTKMSIFIPLYDLQ